LTLTDIDPIFEFADEATAHFPTRKQRLYALAYVPALQTSREPNLKKMVPPNLYRPIRHFLAESDWDHREVIWRSAARLLRQIELDWIACRVSAIPGKWSFAWLAAIPRCLCQAAGGWVFVEAAVRSGVVVVVEPWLQGFGAFGA
jgi:hypothetical protein